MKHSTQILSAVSLAGCFLLLAGCASYQIAAVPVECCGVDNVGLNGQPTIRTDSNGGRALVGELVGAGIRRTGLPEAVRVSLGEAGDWRPATVQPLLDRPRAVQFFLPLAPVDLASLEHLRIRVGDNDATVEKVSAPGFEADRTAILAMAGVFDVSFDFIETVPLAEDYELKERKVSRGQEAVLVIEDQGNVIRLQHILQVDKGEGFAIKHWRQDWIYEPAEIHEFVGHNTWRRRALSLEERRGRWAQVVYQVDDSPRYAAVAEWRHVAEGSVWTGSNTWRPLPRRDATTRDDYEVVVGANRHQITPEGWVHEQDNTKTTLNEFGQPTGAVAREVAINSYRRASSATPTIATRYWEETAAFWTEIRESWARRAADHDVLALMLRGEPEDLYLPILKAAEDYRQGRTTLKLALAQAQAVKDRHLYDGISPIMVERLPSQ